MNPILKRYLFEKHILVADGEKGENTFEVLFSLAWFYGIRVTEGEELVTRDMLLTAGEYLGRDIPEPFYRGFPATVRSLSKEQLLFDQILHYFITYGMRDFENPGHSIFEEGFTRLAFKEGVEEKRFVCLSVADAELRLRGYIDDMLCASRPLSKSAFEVLLTYITEYSYLPERCTSKDTATRLLIATRNPKFVKFLYLSDIIRVVDTLNFVEYKSKNVKKLNLKNADRKFVSALIDAIFEGGYVNLRDCFEKKAIWCGLLHHIHYQPRCEAAEKFCYLMRNKGNQSVWSEVERYMNERDVRRAVDILRREKGTGAVLRSLDYLVSRCKTEQDVDYVVDRLGVSSPMLLVQLIMHYATYSAGGARTFRFVKHGLMSHHVETEEEMGRRRSVLGRTDLARITDRMCELLEGALKGKLGRVYISPEMYKVALPIHESSASGGFGCLPSGSRVPLGEGQKLRAFTYWERVNDIDLSMFAITENGAESEFSWRTMFDRQSEIVTFSGDQTSGFDGGSEYFDVDLDLLKNHPSRYRYVVFCNNVYSGSDFAECFCRAGYMMREIFDTGEVYEPKTVKSAFTVTADSNYAILFAIDLKTRELVWLNTSIDIYSRIAAGYRFSVVLDRMKELDILSCGRLVSLCASELVDNPEDADVAFTDEELEAKEGREQVHSYDFERILAILS